MASEGQRHPQDRNVPAVEDRTRGALSKGNCAWNILDKRQVCTSIALESWIDSSFWVLRGQDCGCEISGDAKRS